MLWIKIKCDCLPNTIYEGLVDTTELNSLFDRITYISLDRDHSIWYGVTCWIRRVWVLNIAFFLVRYPSLAIYFELSLFWLYILGINGIYLKGVGSIIILTTNFRLFLISYIIWYTNLYIILFSWWNVWNPKSKDNYYEWDNHTTKVKMYIIFFITFLSWLVEPYLIHKSSFKN